MSASLRRLAAAREQLYACRSTGLYLSEQHDHAGRSGVHVEAADQHALAESVVVHLPGGHVELLVAHLKGGRARCGLDPREYLRGERAQEVRSVGFTRRLTKVKSPLSKAGTSVDEDLQGY